MFWVGISHMWVGGTRILSRRGLVVLVGGT